MSKIGIFFGTDTGSTRLVAKKIYSLLGAEVADKPKNINRTSVAELLLYDALILGTAARKRIGQNLFPIWMTSIFPASEWPCLVWGIRNATRRVSPVR
jgi:hypothetical protein